MRAARHPFLDLSAPAAIAHRGGALEAAENTLSAFEYAADLGYRYLESDMQVTRDGVLVLFHDEHFDRTTDASGPVAEHTWAQVQQIRTAAGTGQILRVEDALEHFPHHRFNLDLKTAGTIEPFCALMARVKAFDRVLVASFSDRRLSAVRRHFGPRLATAAGPREIARALAAARTGRGFPAGPVALQVPLHLPLGPGRLPILTRALLRAAHERDVHVHVWTISDEATIERLLDLGVDAIMTDRPRLLREVLQRRGQWPER